MQVPPGLTGTLAELHRHSSGALARVPGRWRLDLDGFWCDGYRRRKAWPTAIRR